MVELLAASAVAAPQARPDLTSREREVLMAWLKADATEPALTELGINQAALNKYLRSIRDKYAALGRPARTRASLMDRVIEDLAGEHQQDGLLQLADFI